MPSFSPFFSNAAACSGSSFAAPSFSAASFSAFFCRPSSFSAASFSGSFSGFSFSPSLLPASFPATFSSSVFFFSAASFCALAGGNSSSASVNSLSSLWAFWRRAVTAARASSVAFRAASTAGSIPFEVSKDAQSVLPEPAAACFPFLPLPFFFFLAVSFFFLAAGNSSSASVNRLSNLSAFCRKPATAARASSVAWWAASAAGSSPSE